MAFALRSLSHSRVPSRTQWTRNYSTGMKKTALDPLHKELKGKMVEFAGWSMPIQYEGEGILASHLHCRSKAGLFDVSHMAQLRITGKDRASFLESLVVGDVKGLSENTGTLSLLTNEKGGIIDDTIITNRGDHIFMVVNAGCADKDIAHLRHHLSKYSGDVQLERIDRSLVALQGPSAERVLSKVTGEDLSRLPFMNCRTAKVPGQPDILISRCGYTGEDGFEISVANEAVVDFSKLLLQDSDVHVTGLGARDSLRLEAGLCLYGHDIDDTTTPIEASLLWTIGKRRREEKNFLGADVIIPQIKGGVERKRIGLIVNGPPAREGTTIHDPKSGEQIGKITSGTHSPVLSKSIAMGYVKTPFSKVGTDISVQVRGKTYPAQISKMPFIPTTYKRIEITPV